MRKYVIGMFFGFLISASIGVNAQELAQSLTGRTIQGEFPVKISGKTLEQKAAVVDGTSYLPVRAMGEALNMDVLFNADLGIELRKKVDLTVTTTQPQPTTTKTMTLEQINEGIRDANIQIQVYEGLIELRKKNNDSYSDAESKLAEFKAKLADLERQKAELQAQPAK